MPFAARQTGPRKARYFGYVLIGQHSTRALLFCSPTAPVTTLFRLVVHRLTWARELAVGSSLTRLALAVCFTLFANRLSLKVLC